MLTKSLIKHTLFKFSNKLYRLSNVTGRGATSLNLFRPLDDSPPSIAILCHYLELSAAYPCPFFQELSLKKIYFGIFISFYHPLQFSTLSISSHSLCVCVLPKIVYSHLHGVSSLQSLLVVRPFLFCHLFHSMYSPNPLVLCWSATSTHDVTDIIFLIMFLRYHRNKLS